MNSAREAVMSIRIGQAEHELGYAKVVDDLGRPKQHVEALRATM